MKIAAIQIQCKVGDVAANLSNAERLIQSARGDGAELVCLPELFTTGAAPKMEVLAEPIPGPTTQEFARIAKANSIYLVAGMAEKDKRTGKLHNASVLISPQGELLRKYRKIFLYLGEKEEFVPGNEPCICQLPFGKIGVTICYDYVFPEYIRYLVFRGINLLVHPTAWLTTDECERWKYNNGAYRAMGMTRALENGIYFISANHWGNYDLEGNLRAIGQSSTINPWVEVLAEVDEGEAIAIDDVDFDKPEAWKARVAPYVSDYDAAVQRLDFLNQDSAIHRR